MRKRLAGSGWLFLCVMLLWWSMPCSSFAEETDGGQTEEALEDYMEELLKELDFEEIDEFLKELDVGETPADFYTVVKTFISGDIRGGLRLLAGMLTGNFFQEWKTGRTTLIHVLMIALIAATLTGFSDIFQNRQISEVSYYMVYMLLLAILMKAFGAASSILSDNLGRTVEFMKLLMPVFFMALGFCTGSTTSLVFYEWVLFLISAVQWALKTLLIPAVHIYVLLMLVNQMVKEDFLSKMAELFKLAAEWGLKAMMGAVIGFNLVQGLIAPAVDGFKKNVLSKTAGMLPGVGNVFNSVSELVLGSAILIRNGIGAAALLILAALCLIPVAKLLLFAVSYKLAAAVIQPVSDKRIVECISSVGDGMVLLMKIMLASSVLFWLTLAVLCTVSSG